MTPDLSNLKEVNPFFFICKGRDLDFVILTHPDFLLLETVSSKVKAIV